MTVIIFLIVLAVLIFVHELGHFLFARMCGIRVDAFKIGFGPKIFAWRPKKKDPATGNIKVGETEYGLNLIPFGGYVKIHGENPDEENTHGPDAARSLVNKPRWKQFLVLVAGVLFNVIFAWILYVGLFAHGVTATTDGFEKYSADFSNSRIMVTDVLPDSPAAKANLQVGDVLVGTDVTSIQDKINQSAGMPIAMNYIRGGVTETATTTPIKGLVADKYAIGIAMSNVVDMKLPFFTAVYEGAHYAFIMLRDTAVGLYSFIANIFHGTANFGDVAGPVGIAGIVGSAAKLGWTYLLMITALISINLAIVNLIPFPALDGGRVLFVALEGVIRRRISPRFTNAVNTVGFALLIVLMIVVTYKDIFKLVVK
jgi:regulator of sigma E protease